MALLNFNDDKESSNRQDILSFEKKESLNATKNKDDICITYLNMNSSTNVLKKQINMPGITTNISTVNNVQLKDSNANLGIVKVL